MAVWRNADVEAVLGVSSLDEAGITEAAFVRVVADGANESDQLEFKAPAAYTKAGGGGPSRFDGKQEFAKDVAALANHRGGVILIGVTESGGQASKVLPASGSLTDAERRTRELRLALQNNVAPQPVVDVIGIEVAGGGYVVAVVVRQRAPHSVLTPANNKNPLVYPVRNGQDTRYLDEPEVADRYTRRLTVGQDSDSRLGQVVEQGRHALRRMGADLWVYAGLTPEIPATARMNAAALAHHAVWLDGQNFEEPSGDQAFSNMTTRAAPRRSASNYSGLSYVELGVDGSAFAAMCVATNRGPSSSSANFHPWQVDLRILTESLIVIHALLAQWTTATATAPGAAVGRTGLVNAADAALNGARDMELQTPNPLTNTLHQVSNTERLPWSAKPLVDTIWDLTQPSTMTAAVAHSSVVLDELVQWFGLASCPLVTPAGEVVAGRWPHGAQQHVSRWSQKYNVPIA